MQNQNGKTKTAMLIELESIKDLLVEDDDIPILQEVIVSQPTTALEETQQEENLFEDSLFEENQPESILLEKIQIEDNLSEESSQEENWSAEEHQEVFLLEVEATPEDIDLALNPTAAPENLIVQEQEQEQIKEHKTEQQQDFFGLSVFGDLPTPSTTQYTDIKTATSLSETKPVISRTASAKPAGQNPFLPEHIRARLHGNNPPPTFTLENTPKNKNPNPFTRSSTNQAQYSSTKKMNAHQQQLIDDIMDSMLPEIERELRERLETMSKTALAELLAEHK